MVADPVSPTLCTKSALATSLIMKNFIVLVFTVRNASFRCIYIIQAIPGNGFNNNAVLRVS